LARLRELGGREWGGHSSRGGRKGGAEEGETITNLGKVHSLFFVKTSGSWS